ESLIGLRRPTTGSIQLEGREIANSSTAERIRAGLGYVPDDRILWGLFPGLSVAENLISERHASQPIARNGFLNRKVIDSNARDLVKEFDIRPDDPSVPVGILSGGNKQKVIVSRVFSRRPRAWVIHQPTRGLDVGATEHIRQLILDERDRGAAILLISADLDEVFALSDRLAVIYEGRFTAVMSSVNATRERVGLLMAGLAYEADQKTAGSIHQ